jgi:RNA polymerase sigma-70 factor (ECF subfamily)
MEARTADGESLFDQLVFQKRHLLFLLAFGILRDRGEAEDAVQETLVRAWRSWAKSSGYDDRLGWAKRICVNYCISRRRSLLSRGFFTNHSISKDLPAEGGALNAAEAIDMDRAIRRLSVKQRAALALTKGHGHSVEEAAALMGCSPGSVRTHIARGLAGLRREMKDD